MWGVFLPYIFIYITTGLIEFIIPLQSKKENITITCYYINLNNTNLTNITIPNINSSDYDNYTNNIVPNFNTTNLTSILNNKKDDDSLFGLIDNDTLGPSTWMLLNAAVDIASVLIILFIFMRKKK